MRRLLSLVVLMAAPAWAQEYPPEAPPLIPVETALRAFGFPIAEDEPLEVAWGDAIVIDVQVVLASGVSTSRCQEGINRINQTIANSNVGPVTVRLVNCLPTTYVSSGDGQLDLSRFSGGVFIADGFLDQVHTERDRVGADMNILIGTSMNVCGIAYLVAGTNSAFAYVADGCISNSSLEHEWGHNVGMQHDQPNAGSCPFGYGCGYCFGNGRKDVLTYPSPCGGTRVARYSNPDVLDLGVPSGTVTANNARVLRERAAVLANFRNQMMIPAPRISGVPVLTED